MTRRQGRAGAGSAWPRWTPSDWTAALCPLRTGFSCFYADLINSEPDYFHLRLIITWIVQRVDEDSGDPSFDPSPEKTFTSHISKDLTEEKDNQKSIF